METKPENALHKICKLCETSKLSNEFYKINKNVCIECNNKNRREKYKTDEEYRLKTILNATNFKKNKIIEKNKIKQEEQEKIGQENKQCKYCKEVKLKTRFRHNRLKCKDCERDDPNEKFKRYVRTRIYNCLRNKNKLNHSSEYLGCTFKEYIKWISNYDATYNLENYGPIWHIDHVIPLSTFDLNDKDQQFIAFNWRNTMPLSAYENMSKNNRISHEQILKHYDKLIKYHEDNSINIPQIFVELFAKHLDAGSPLEPN
jgi:hypothetical protein